MTMTASMGGASAAKAPRDFSGERPAMARVVRAVIGKELRQNWVNLALVICLEFIIVCVAEWFRSGWLFDSIQDNQINNVLLLPSVQMSMMLGCGVAGLLLGALQPLADRNFDLWAFLNHRPVPRWWLYLGRALAGLIMYGIAAGLPVGFAMAIAPTRMGGPFFISEYWLPPIADLAAGFVYYLAGLLIMEREARWYGSRVMPLVVALVGSGISDSVYSFWTAVASSLVLIVIYAIATWGSAVSHGFTLRTPKLTRWTLAILLLGGFTVLAMVPTATALDRLFGRRSNLLQSGSIGQGLWTHEDRIVYHSHELMPDGTIANVFTTDQWNETKGRYERSDAYTDLQGQALGEPDVHDSYNTWNQQVNFWGRTEFRRRNTFRDLGYEVERISGPIWNSKYENEWYWVPSRQLFYVYKQINWQGLTMADHREAWWKAQYLGAFGVNGLQRGKALPFDRASVRNFFGDGPMVETPTILYWLDAEHILLKPFFVAKGGEEILEERLLESQPGKIAEPMRLLIFTTQRVVEIAPDGTEVFSLPFSHDPVQYRIVLNCLPKVHEWALEYFRKPVDGKYVDADSEGTFEFFDEAGKLLKIQKVSNWWRTEVAATPVLLPRGLRKLHRFDYRAGAISGVGGPLAFGSILLSEGGGSLPGVLREYRDFQSAQYPLGWQFTAPALLIMVTYAAGAWVLAWGYARSIRLRVAWTVLGILFGPAALLTFVAVNRLPRRVRCPRCGRLRLLREERCRACGAAWEEPPASGTEIFT